MSDGKPDMVALMTHLAKAIVDAPDEVTVEPFEENGQTVLELIVAEEDLGRVIGRPDTGVIAILDDGITTALVHTLNVAELRPVSAPPLSATSLVSEVG